MDVETKFKIGDRVKLKRNTRRGYIYWVQRIPTFTITKIDDGIVYTKEVEEVTKDGYMYLKDLEHITDVDIVGILNKEI